MCPTAGWLTSDDVGLQAVDAMVSLHRQASKNIKAAVEHTTSMGRGECSVARHALLHALLEALGSFSASYPPDVDVGLHYLALHHAAFCTLPALSWHPLSTFSSY